MLNLFNMLVKLRRINRFGSAARVRRRECSPWSETTACHVRDPSVDRAHGQRESRLGRSTQKLRTIGATELMRTTAFSENAGGAWRLIALRYILRRHRRCLGSRVGLLQRARGRVRPVLALTGVVPDLRRRARSGRGHVRRGSMNYGARAPGRPSPLAAGRTIGLSSWRLAN